MQCGRSFLKAMDSNRAALPVTVRVVVMNIFSEAAVLSPISVTAPTDSEF
jgi:hypothetical protein